MVTINPSILGELGINEQLRKTSAHAYMEQLTEEHLIPAAEKDKYEVLAFRNFTN